jgi:molybdate transport system ATP-binding protein
MRFDVDIAKRVVAQGRAFDLAVQFRVDAQRLALFGPSGAGKSLTLQVLAGLVRPDHGRIVIDGEVWLDRARNVDVPTRARHVGYVFQDYALFPHRTVHGNVAAALARWYPRRLAQAERRDIDELLDAFALDDVRNSYPVQLSGGQRQRTALARAIAAHPRLLLLDEPFSSLDSDLRLRLRADLLDVQRRYHIPIVLITHDPDDLAQCAESVVVLSDGRVARHATDAASFPTSASCLAQPREPSREAATKTSASIGYDDAGHRPECGPDADRRVRVIDPSNQPALRIARFAGPFEAG